ncbi:MAG: SusC/RagA family TonB-linked outer membrane protein [Tannerellaceae bacterium]|jgi:TonB-linked SusC/RagA family outer membrane protein|nr:SusC/RagA family TonB-linked outer membrane protein [Tannerellaceae bacterium]
MKHFLFSLLGQLLLFSTLAYGQTVLKGVVIDERTGDAIIGVTVLQKSTTNGVATDIDGAFQLNIQSALPVTLVARSLGYRSQEIAVYEANETIRILLNEDINLLEEVVVTGLATRTKRANLANDVTSISSKELVGTITPETIDNALYGRVPGASVRTNSGAPGGGISIQLRGINSLQGASQPLYIIDGVYLNNDVLSTGRSSLTSAGQGGGEDDASNRLADLNPDDIETIEVLKGPSASAIYGTRANAGVIIITTKKGKEGKTQVRFTQEVGYAELSKHLGASTWDEDKIRLFFPAASQETELKRYREAAANGRAHNDFEELLYGEKPLITSTNLSVSGGNAKTKFFASGHISEEGGIIKHTGFGRKSIRLNVEHTLSQYVNFSINSNYLYSNSDRGFTGNQNRSGSSIGYILGYTPAYFDPRPVNGIYPDNPYVASANENPLELRDKAVNNAKVNRFVEAANLNVAFFRTEKASLNLALQGGLDYLTQKSFEYFPEYLQLQRSAQNPGILYIGNTYNSNLNLQGFLIYNQQVNKLNFVTQAGAVGLQSESESIFNQSEGLVSSQTNLKQATVIRSPEHSIRRVKDFSLVAQEEVNFDDKVITTLGIRFDKSTLNGDPNTYYAFPRASLAVNLNKFNFWNLPAVSLLKLRAAYGETGGLPNFGVTFTSLSTVVLGGNLGSILGTSAGNKNIKPERAGELEVGFNVGFLKDRILFDATYYDKTVRDLIQTLNMSPSSGVGSQRVNGTTLKNKGVELALTLVPYSTNRFTWTSRILYWSNRSKITKLAVPSYTSGIYGLAYGTYLFKEGYSPTTIVGNPRKENGEYTVYGNSQPDFQSSWYNTISFLNGFDFSFLLDWKKGGQVMNITLYNTDNGGTTPDWNDDWNGDGIPNGKDREGKGTAGVYVQEGGYLKLREVALKYTLPRKITEHLSAGYIHRIQIGASANNLLTLSPYPGYDPEVNSFGTTATNTGSDLFNYPPSRRFLFNLQIEF